MKARESEGVVVLYDLDSCTGVGSADFAASPLRYRAPADVLTLASCLPSNPPAAGPALPVASTAFRPPGMPFPMLDAGPRSFFAILKTHLRDRFMAMRAFLSNTS